MSEPWERDGDWWKPPPMSITWSCPGDTFYMMPAFYTVCDAEGGSTSYSIYPEREEPE